MALNRVMNIIFDHKEEFSDAEYLELCNTLQKLHRPVTPPEFPPTPLPPVPRSITPNRFLVNKPTPHLPEITYLHEWRHALLRFVPSNRLLLIDKVCTMYEVLNSRGIVQPSSLKFWKRAPSAYLKDALDLCDIPPTMLKRMYDSTKERRMRMDGEVRKRKIEETTARIIALI